MKKIKTLAAAAVVAVSLFSMQGDAMAAEANTISVRGIAKQEVAPDMAYLTLGISVKGDTAESVRTQVAEASQKVRRALRISSLRIPARLAEMPEANELYRLWVPRRASSSCSILKAIGSLISTSPSST